MSTPGTGEHTALYRLYDATDVLLYVGITKNITQRWQQHAWTKPWWPEVARSDVRFFDRRDDALLAERRAIRAESPLHQSPRDPQGPRVVIRAPLSDEDAAIEQELIEYRSVPELMEQARTRRQEAVIRAREAGWSKYKIAAVLGVRGPTVDSIISAAGGDTD